jgi:hypothetical protein
MKKILFTLSFLFTLYASKAQEAMGYYYDYNQHFYCFYKGNNFQLESNKVDSIRAGIDYIAYIDQRGDLVTYYNGNKFTIEEDVPNQMIATPYALVYKMAQRLMIFEHGEKKELSKWVGHYYADQYIVTWQELPSLNIMAYENGITGVVESSVSSNVINSGQTGPNIFAYTDITNSFKIYYSGQVYETGATQITDYQCGKNIAAYIDKFNNTFNVFYNNKIKVLSDHLPKSYAVAANMVSYIDWNDNFMLYYNGKTIQLETYIPTTNVAQDNLIVYYNDIELKILFGGQTYIVDKFVPQQSVLLGPSSAMYLDNNNRPKYFYKGKTYSDFMTEPINNMYMIWDLPVFRYGNNTIGFYYEGKIYDYETYKY